MFRCQIPQVSEDAMSKVMDMEAAWRPGDVSKNEEFCGKNEELCTKNYELCRSTPLAVRTSGATFR